MTLTTPKLIRQVGRVVSVVGPGSKDKDLRYAIRLREKATAQYNTWLERVATLPAQSLTEEQWLAACSFFDGCAMCNSTDIAARSFFIPFTEGGKYTAWNIIPTCERCTAAITNARQLNPWWRCDQRISRDIRRTEGQGSVKIAIITKYLQARMDELS